MAKTYNAIRQLIRVAEDDPHLQARIALSESPQQLITIAAEAGVQLPLQELRETSRELSAPYWPWASKGNSYRRMFFK